MTPQHTPTPWKLQGPKGMSIVTEDGRWVAGLDSSSPEDRAYIVRAINAHDELIRNLKQSHNLNVDLMVALETIVKDIENGSLGNAVSVARYAIAKAEGK